MRSTHWLKLACLSGVFCCGSLHAQSEQLELKKIAEYWKEKDYRVAKMHIRQFLEKFPKSGYTDQIHTMLGDLLFQEKNYSEALDAYNKIGEATLLQKCQAARLHSLYVLGRYESFVQSAVDYLKNLELKNERDQIVCFETGEAYFYLAHQKRENNSELLEKALSYYQRLEETPLAEKTLLPKARIYALLQKPAQAAALYLTAAHTSNAYEEYLFEAANQQYLFDPIACLTTFERIVEKGGEYAPKAAFNHLMVLFEQKQYKEFVLQQEKTQGLIPEDKDSLVRFYLGMSQFHLEDFARAVPLLEASCKNSDLRQAQRKNALIALGMCGVKMQDSVVLEKALQETKAEFATDLEASRTLLMHAEVCRALGQNGKARVSIKEFLSLFPHCAEKEILSYDYGLLLFDEENWEEAGSAMQAFLRDFDTSEHKADAFRYFVHARSKSVQQASFETLKIKQEQLVEAITLALDETLWTQAEREQLHLLAGNTLISLSRYEEAIKMLERNQDSTSLLLLGECALQGKRDELLFASYVEKALDVSSDRSEVLDLRVKLFNTYLSQAEKAQALEKTELLAKAAEHLFLALDKPISVENAKWLASYYCETGGHVEKAIQVLEHLLQDKKYQPEEEAEILKLASLYKQTGNHQKWHELLDSLVQSEQQLPDLKFNYRRLAQFEYASSCVAMGKSDRAIKMYEELISSSEHATSYFACASALEKAKLEFSLLKPEDGENLEHLCDTFKEIEVQRKLHSEPLHLEAALWYIDAKTAFMEESDKRMQQHFLLENLKENFSCLERPEVIYYLSAASQFPEKERLYRHYMAYVEARLLSLEEQKEAAKQKLDQLLTETDDTLLQMRIQKSKEALAR